jgi:hypothetical protein
MTSAGEDRLLADSASRSSLKIATIEPAARHFPLQQGVVNQLSLAFIPIYLVSMLPIYYTSRHGQPRRDELYGASA